MIAESANFSFFISFLQICLKLICARLMHSVLRKVAVIAVRERCSGSDILRRLLAWGRLAGRRHGLCSRGAARWAVESEYN
jgi:hypothetical protein